MDSSIEGGKGLGKRENQNSLKRERPSYQRLSSNQVEILEKFMKECPHPDENQRLKLAADVGIEPKQIKFWFQNKRTQMKNKHEKEDSNALKIENDEIKKENREIKEALKKMFCQHCGNSMCRDGDHQQHMETMLLENVVLKAKCRSILNALSSYVGEKISPYELHAIVNATIASSPYVPPFGNSVNQAAIDQVQIPNRNLPSQSVVADLFSPQVSNILSTDPHKSLMTKVAITALDELMKLMQIHEPFWINSLASDGKFILSLEAYEQIFPKIPHFNGPNICIESSKWSTQVNMSGMNLVDMFLNSDKWVNCFPTIVTNAKTIHVVDNGLLENRSGALKLMYGKMHTMSPLVPAREFCFLRYCQQVGVGKWAIMDVSFDPYGANKPISHCWKHPSGCIIQEIHSGSSVVSWIEHVEVNDNISQTHPLFYGVVCNNAAFGAERWLMELKRVCDRMSLLHINIMPIHDVGGVINSLEGMRSVMNLSHRMMKNFCENLIIIDKFDFAPERNIVFRACFRKSEEPGEPNGLILIAISSLWLPHPYEQVYNFLKDHTKRNQWDVLYHGGGGVTNKIAQISTRNQPGNSISIIQRTENVLILQENFIDPIGAYIVYAPVEVAHLNVAINGEDSALVPILPSGFVISGDGKSNETTFGASSSRYGERSGSLLTFALQTFVSPLPGTMNIGMGTVSQVYDILNLTVGNIKVALSCNSVE